MGRITDKIKRDVLDKFEQEKFKTDLFQKIDKDGFGFKIVREGGKVLTYDGSDRQYRTGYTAPSQNDLLKITDIENLKEIIYKGNTHVFVRKNTDCERGNGKYDAYNFRCRKENHNITLYVDNGTVEYAETGYGLG